MKILVVGGSGFVGSHVADHLSDAGHDVSIFAPERSPYLRDDQRMIIGDITSVEDVDRAVAGHEVVYNFASVAAIKEASENPIAVTRVNVLGTVHLLEACRAHAVERFILASSVYVYSHSGSIYKASKQAAERFVEAYLERYNAPTHTIARVGTVYGPRAQAWNGFRQLITDAVTKNSVVYNGSGDEVRAFIHVYDVAASFVDLLDPEYENAHVMITGQEQVRARDFTDMLAEMFGGTLDVTFAHEGASRPDHYTITPFSYRPKMAKKMVRSTYIELGQGILEYLHELQCELHGVDHTGIPNQLK